MPTRPVAAKVYTWRDETLRVPGGDPRGVRLPRAEPRSRPCARWARRADRGAGPRRRGRPPTRVGRPVPHHGAARGEALPAPRRAPARHSITPAAPLLRPVSSGDEVHHPAEGDDDDGDDGYHAHPHASRAQLGVSHVGALRVIAVTGVGAPAWIRASAAAGIFGIAGPGGGRGLGFRFLAGEDLQGCPRPDRRVVVTGDARCEDEIVVARLGTGGDRDLEVARPLRARGERDRAVLPVDDVLAVTHESFGRQGEGLAGLAPAGIESEIGRA